MPYNPSKKYLRPDRKKFKQPDIGEGPTKLCILGLINKESPKGCTVAGILNLLGLHLRSQGQTRIQRFVDDLEDRKLIEKIDMPHISKNTKGYVIAKLGKTRLEQYFSIEFRDLRDLSQPLKGTALDDLRRFWDVYGKDY